jgi:hypothetical protein
LLFAADDILPGSSCPPYWGSGSAYEGGMGGLGYWLVRGTCICDCVLCWDGIYVGSGVCTARGPG